MGCNLGSASCPLTIKGSLDLLQSNVGNKKPIAWLAGLLVCYDSRQLRFPWKLLLTSCQGESPLSLISVTNVLWRMETDRESFGLQSYMTTMTILQLSNHRLAIETGRHMRLYKKPNERTCPLCKRGAEDEKHFLVSCPVYQENRKSLWMLV